MTTALEHVRYSCGIAGEEVANYVDELERQLAAASAEKDAARYRWCKLYPERAASIFEHLGSAYFDSEIDAAMQGKTE